MLDIVSTVSLVNKLDEKNLKEVILKIGYLSFVEEIGATKREVANYFGIGIRTVEKYLKENNNELLKYGKTIFTRESFVTEKFVDYKISEKTRKIILLNKKHILFLACLLANKSYVAKSIVNYLLEIESKASNELKFDSLQNSFQGVCNEIDLKKELERLRLCLEKSKPLVEFVEVIKESKSEISLNDFAKSTYQRFKIGRNTLFKILKEQKILTTRNKPFQKYLNRGYFVVKLKMINGQIKYQPLLTGKGQVWLFQTIKKIVKKYEESL